jgi:peptide/nickel transport system substrate-binding protein
MAAASLAAASCAQPTPQVIEKPVTVVVEKEVPVEKEVVKTVVVEKEVPVEKVVQQTVVVEKERVVEKEVAVEKVVTATPVQMKYKEAPLLAGRVQAGDLPPVDERLPENPLVLTPVEEVGQYGGTWHRLAVGPNDIRTPGRLMYENLIRSTADGTEMYPNVAESWEMAPDGKSCTFKLRKGMKWSDGAPFTAHDLVFHVEDHWANEEISPSFPKAWSPGGERMRAEAIDDYTARYIFAAPFGLFVGQVAAAAGVQLTLRPKHYLSQFHAAYVDQAKLAEQAKEAGFEAWYQLYGSKQSYVTQTELPGLMAWIAKVPPPKQPVVHERNPYYWKVDTAGNQLPYIDRMEHMLVNSKDIVNMRAMSGEVDMQWRHMDFGNYPLFLESREQGDYRVFLWESGKRCTSVLWINQTTNDPVLRPLLETKEFRWALSLGINRQEIIDGVFLGVGEPTQPSALPSSDFFSPEQAYNLIEHDPDRANQLLDEIGLTERDGDGYRLRPDGERLSILFEYAPIFGPWGDIGELISNHWKELGIEFTVKEIARSLLYERMAANEVQMTMWMGANGFNPLLQPLSFIPTLQWMSPGYYDWWRTGGKEGEEPPPDMLRALELYDEILITVDRDKQLALWDEILEINKENLWCLGIVTSPPEPVIVKNDCRNVMEHALSDVNLLTPGSTMPEQYFIRA